MDFKRSKGPFRFELKGPAVLESLDGTVEVADDNYEDYKQKGTAGKKSVLKVKGPGVPLSLFVFQGRIRVTDWKASVFVFSKKADIEGFRSQGSWQLSLKRGSLKLKQFTGSLKVKGFHLNMDLENLKGISQIQFNEGRLKVQKGEGSLAYFTDKGNMDIKGWKGDVSGESVSGSLKGLLSPGSVQIFSEKGTLRMSFLKTRPLVKAFSESGRIRSPRYMNRKYEGKSLTVEGWLRGSGAKEGKVVLKTDRGNIYIH